MLPLGEQWGHGHGWSIADKCWAAAGAAGASSLLLLSFGPLGSQTAAASIPMEAVFQPAGARLGGAGENRWPVISTRTVRKHL